MSMKLRLG